MPTNWNAVIYGINNRYWENRSQCANVLKADKAIQTELSELKKYQDN